MILAPTPVWAQQTDPRPEARAVRIHDTPPTIDGRLDDPAWDAAPVVTGLVQKIPDEGAPARERTEVWFLYDDEALYVGARMYSDDPSAIQAPVSRRDQTFQAEQILIALDTFLDRRTAYGFAVTASGVRMERYHPRDAERPSDTSWDPVWEARARVDSLGWTAEMRIPFSQLRFRDRPAHVWGMNINRWIPKRNEDDFWVMVPESETGYASRFGDLVGIEGIPTPRRIELVPYVAGNATFTAEPDPADPFKEERDGTLRVGGDLKVGLGPGLTLDATINPDFGQVEADPAEVNLSAFETFFRERRPFFLEGNELFDARGPRWFYSRRIGASPSGSAPGDFVDVPRNTTILGAGKVTGRLGSGVSLGVLAAATAAERARTFDAETGAFDTIEVEPLTGYGVGRLQQQFGPDQSTAGLMVTGVRRDLAEGHPLAKRLPKQAFTGAADWTLRFRGGEYEVFGYAGFSHVEGDTAALVRLQSSSARYFQRPDADHVEFDPARTSLSGWTAALGIERNSGEHWLWEAFLDARSPGLEINDVGRLSRTDRVFGLARITYRETRPGPYWQSWSVSARSENQWNFDGDRTFAALRTDAEWRLRNFWGVNFTAWVDLRGQSDVLTRGGPLMGTGRAWATIGGFGNSFTANHRWRARVHYGESELGEETLRLSGEFSFRPAPRWRLSLEPTWSKGVDPRQFVTSVDGGGEDTFGRRYVFSFVDRTTISTRLRLDYTFRPDLTLELYAEPFTASGRFHDFGELAAAESRELRTYGEASGTAIEEDPEGVYEVTDGNQRFSFTRPDFNVRSFRSNAVLRWEWLPGSTLFLVWQQDRSSDTAAGHTTDPADLWDALETPGDNFLAVKATYWLPIGG